MVSEDLHKELVAKCAYDKDIIGASAIIDYFLKHGLTKFADVVLLEDDEVERIPAEDKDDLKACVNGMKAEYAASVAEGEL